MLGNGEGSLTAVYANEAANLEDYSKFGPGAFE